MKYILFYIAITNIIFSQQNPNFNVTLRLDFSSVESLLELSNGRISNAGQVAKLRGNQIAAVTSALLARQKYLPQNFSRELERFASGVSSNPDIFGLEQTLNSLPKIKSLLLEAQRRQLDRKIIATIEPFFPSSTNIHIIIPVYFVAFGHENAAAYVRRIRWEGNTPHFVGDNEGELTIIVNLARSVQYIQEIQLQFIDMMSTLAHETFHVVFGTYKNTSPVWNVQDQKPEPYWILAELTQNEGIAYLISLQQHTGARLSDQQLAASKRTIASLNNVLKELSSQSITTHRAQELIMDSNLSGSYEKNYGASAGLLMAYAIDTKLGRKALTTTIQNGVGSFFAKYQELTLHYGELPKFDDEILLLLK